MRWSILALVMLALAGCTAVSLERHTLAQTGSAADLRYREVLDNLAMISDDPSALPAYSSIFAGTASVTDSGQLTSTTVWQAAKGVGSQDGFASQLANPQASRTVLENWTLDPIVVPEKLEAMRCACRWVIYGPQAACEDCPGLLVSPEQAPPGPGRHFDVADRLARLPAGWLRRGTLKDVPPTACYKAHSGHTWVWVTPDGLRGLADFTLVLQDIARVDSNSPTLFNFPLQPSSIQFKTSDKDLTDGEIRTATVVIDPTNWRLSPDQPYYKARIENLGSESRLRGQTNAAGVTR